MDTAGRQGEIYMIQLFLLDKFIGKECGGVVGIFLDFVPL